MNYSICFCGAAAEYPHEPDCPYPMFRGTAAQEQKWMDDRERARVMFEKKPLTYNHEYFYTFTNTDKMGSVSTIEGSKVETKKNPYTTE